MATVLYITLTSYPDSVCFHFKCWCWVAQIFRRFKPQVLCTEPEAIVAELLLNMTLKILIRGLSCLFNSDVGMKVPKVGFP